MPDEIQNPPAGDPPAGNQPPANQPPANNPPAGDPPPSGKPPAGDPPPGDGKPPAAKPGEKADPKTVIDAKDDPNAKPVVPTWPDDWRQQLAGADEKALAMLNRFASPADLYKSFKETKDKLAKGELKPKASEPPTEPEALKAWRAENDIPETPEKYEIKLGEGLVIGDDDKPIVDTFLKGAHEDNIPQSVVNKVLNRYFQMQEDHIVNEQTQDAIHRETAQEDLRKEFGGNFLQTMKLVGSTLANAFGNDLAEDIKAARLPDGTLLGDNPAIVKGLASMGQRLYPAATVVPNSSNPAQSIETELAELKKKIGTPEWMTDTKSQNRYQELLVAQARLTT